MNLDNDKGSKMTEPDFRFLNLGGQEGEKPPFLGVFRNFLKNGSNDFDQTLRFGSPQRYLPPGENRMSVKILVRAVHMYENGLF